MGIHLHLSCRIPLSFLTFSVGCASASNSTLGYKVSSPTSPKFISWYLHQTYFLSKVLSDSEGGSFPIYVFMLLDTNLLICLNINAAVRIYYFRILFSHNSVPIPIGFMIPFGPTPRVAIQTFSCKKIPFVLQILSILGLLFGYPMGFLYTWQRVTMGKSSVNGPTTQQISCSCVCV